MLACTVKTGNRYRSEYVNKLANSLRRNGYNKKLICFCDTTEGLDHYVVQPYIIPEPDCSWWDKLYLFSWEFEVQEDLLFFDLDSVVVGSIVPFLKYQGEFATGSRFNNPAQINSTLLGIRREFGRSIWSQYRQLKKEGGLRSFAGDSNFIEWVIGPSTDRWDDLVPGGLVSYKKHVRRFGLSINARVVSFHGKPDPHEVTDQFVRKHWR